MQNKAAHVFPLVAKAHKGEFLCAINLMCATCVALITPRVWFGALFVATGKAKAVSGFIHGLDFLQAWHVLSRAGFGFIGFHARPFQQEGDQSGR